MKLPDSLLSNFKKIVGEKNVLSKEVDLLLYSYDAAIDRATPSCAVFPENAEQISSIIKICQKNKIPFVARGAGTNLCGGTIPLHQAVVIAPTKMNRIISIDPERKIAVVEPGLPNLFLKKALEPYRLTYAPDPASQKSCTIGGNIGTNAGGPHCLKYGVTSHHVLGLQVVLPDGEIVETSLTDNGSDLTGFFVGSEGTLGIVTRAVLNLIPIPKFVETMLVSFNTLESAIQTVTEIVANGILPATLEAMDKVTVRAVEEFIHAGYPQDAEAVLLIEVDGDKPLTMEIEKIRMICEKNSSIVFRLAKNEEERQKLWEGRRGSYPAMARRAPNVLVEDGAVPRNKLPEASKQIRKIAMENGLTVSLIFHAGDGNLHPQILFDERDAEQTKKVKQAGYAMLKVCVDLGGTISGEHGIGMDKREAMRWLFTPETLQLFRKIKEAFDPENLCNPDKLIPSSSTSPSPLKGEGMSQISPRPYVSEGDFFEPKSEGELCSILHSLSQKKEKCFIAGSRTKTQRIPQNDCRISTKSLNKIIEHDAENFTVTAEAGILAEELQNVLKQKNQKVFLPAVGTLGGLIAENPVHSPRIRDQILGLKFALADGTIIQAGAKVMKNVAGYDIAKLLLGSRGTLGVIISVILKTYPSNYEPPAAAGDGKRETEDGETIYRLPSTVSSVLKQLNQKIKKAFDPEEIFPSFPSPTPSPSRGEG